MADIVLVGFMGCGKSEVGKLLAGTLNLGFVDLDEEISREAGMPISRIFERYGEGRFRELERAAVERLAARPPGRSLVVAAGGGTMVDPGNLQKLREMGVLVWLRAPLEAMMERTVGKGGRPLLDVPDPRARFAELYAERLQFYRQADFEYDATADVEGCARELARVFKASTPVPVRAGQRPYTAFVGEGILGLAGETLGFLRSSPRCMVVTNPGVMRLYGETLLGSLEAAGFEPDVIRVPAGEQHKTLAWASRLYDRALWWGLDRGCAMLAFGGGVVGDLTGFAASTYMRGVPFVQIPTTLLAQVDASVGGKVAVNHPRAKNLIGAFYQPRAVISDVGVLQSLPEEEFRSGLAEAIKHGAALDESYYEFIEANLEGLMAREPADLIRLVSGSCRLKASVVERDEKEAGPREVLNLGHTLAHALESTGRYRQWSHGDAVAVGMLAAAELSRAAGLCGPELPERLRALLRRAGFPLEIKAPPGELIPAMRVDKKVRAGRPRFVLLREVGEAVTGVEVSADLVGSVLAGLRGK